MSRSIKFAKAGGPDVLVFIEMVVPSPGPREVRIDVKAIGINRADSNMSNRLYSRRVLDMMPLALSMPWERT